MLRRRLFDKVFTWAESPPFQGGVAAALRKWSRSLTPQTGRLVINRRLRTICKERFAGIPLPTAPSASQPPRIGKAGIHLVAALLCLLCTVPLIAAKQSNAPAPMKVFADGVGKYVTLHQDLASSAPAQKTTNESEQITDRQQQLTGIIANARRDAYRGEIFTEDVSEHFRKIIRKAFQEPGGRAMRQTVRERDPIKPIVLKVNEVYPDDQPRTTMPPTLLSRLPALPKELAYRIVGHALVLQDTKTNLIVDFIPNAIP